MLKFKLKKEWREFCALLKSIPTVVIVLFVSSVFAMNLLANKSISLPVEWLALDCGIVVSWFAFFIMDVLTKHFGPKAATQITALAIVVNLFFCLLLYIGSVIPGEWGESYVDGSQDILNDALNSTFGGAWYVILGSTAAFFISSVVNNSLNFAIGKLFKRKPDGLTAYILRAHCSTAVGQFVDNLIFALLVSHFFFGWSLVQCVTCAATGMLAELLCEAIFFYPGYQITKRWKKDNVGEEYFKIKKGKDDENADNGDE